MRQRMAGLVTAGVLGMGLAGCGVASDGSAERAARGEMCRAVTNLSANLEPVGRISPATPIETVKQVRNSIEADAEKVIEKRGMLPEDLRTSMSSARKQFVTAVDTFGGTGTVGSAAPRLNEPYQSFKGRVSAIRDDVDCSQAAVPEAVAVTVPALKGKDAKMAEICTAVNDLSAKLAPVMVINSATPFDQVKKLRDDIEQDVDKLIETRSYVDETLRTGLSSARKQFKAAVDAFGSPATAGSSGPRFHELFMAVKGRVLGIRDDVDCSSKATS